MNREDLKQKAAARRNQADTPTASSKVAWRCAFCEHDFQSEVVFMKHRCKEKARHDELRSPLGQAAYSYYAHWMKAQRHSVPAIDNFSASKFYTTFIKFAEYATRTRLPNVMRFIEVMVENDKVPPSLWCRDSVYAMYLQGYDAAVPPEKQFVASYDTLVEMAGDLRADLKDVFPAIGVETLINLIQKKKLSHWFLLASDAFKTYLRSLPPEDRERVTMSMNIGAAVERIRQEHILFKEFGRGTKEMGL